LGSSTNKTDRQNITEILLTVALNTIDPKHKEKLHATSINNNKDLFSMEALKLQKK